MDASLCYRSYRIWWNDINFTDYASKKWGLEGSSILALYTYAGYRMLPAAQKIYGLTNTFFYSRAQSVTE